jgi:sporulation protein YlmC with PRC-barrel domain
MKEDIMVIEQVREGMHVVAPDGKKIGKVEDLKMGDPEAVTSDGQVNPETGGLVGTVIDDFAATSNLPHHTAERLLRIGYVKVDKSGLFAGHAYLASDELDRVEGDTLWIKEGLHPDR